ncbi:WbqC family protein [Paraburkholderia sp. SIMBA_049]
MQPYFFPYAGYFRLLARSDVFVIYDCVQFPRRGWVHRNKLPDINGAEQWLTLPLRKAPQDALISDLQFSSDARDVLIERLRSFPLRSLDPAMRMEAMEIVLNTNQSVVDYLESTLAYVARQVRLPWSVVRSSSLSVPQSFRGQDRIIEIARRVGATHYINSPGGRDLYNAEVFAQAGMTLEFLPPYAGPSGSMLGRMLAEPADLLWQDISAEQS